MANNNNNTNTNTRYVSPCGKSLYARLQTPDTQFDTNGIYHVDLLVEPKQAQSMINTIETVLNDFYENDEAINSLRAKAQSKGKSIAIIKAPIYEEMQDGTYRFRFKQKAKIQAKDGTVYDKKVAVFDSKVKPLTDQEVGNGSTIKVSYTCKPYYSPVAKTAGVSLRLVGVQVLDLVVFNTSSADSCGFTSEDGFEATPEEQPQDPAAKDFESLVQQKKPQNTVTDNDNNSDSDDSDDDGDFAF